MSFASFDFGSFPPAFTCATFATNETVNTLPALPACHLFSCALSPSSWPQRGPRRPAAASSLRCLAVGESSVILLHPHLPSVGGSIAMGRGCQQNGSLADGWTVRPEKTSGRWSVLALRNSCACEPQHTPPRKARRGQRVFKSFASLRQQQPPAQQARRQHRRMGCGRNCAELRGRAAAAARDHSTRSMQRESMHERGQVAGGETVILLSSPSPSILKHLLRVEGGAAKTTVPALANRPAG